MKSSKQPRRWVRTVVRTLIAAAIFTVLGNVVFVIADDGASVGQTIPSLAWIQLSDGKGIAVWNYELAINFKTDFFDVGAAVSAMFSEFLWRGYLGCTVLSIWFLDWVISFDWLTVIVAPLTAVGDALREIIAKFGLAPAFLMLAGLVGAVFILRGKIARGIYEMLMACLIVALSVTAFANPMALVAGPDGWIYQARDHTLELVAAMGDQSQTDQKAITAELITTFVRQPVQLISFGQILDGTSCESVYDEAVSSGPHGYESTVRDAVKDCNKSAGTYAETPNGGMVASAVIQSPAGLMVLLMAVLVGGTVMLALVTAVLAAMKTMVNLVLAVLPGGARRPLAHSFAEVFISIAVFVFAMFFLGVYLMVIQSVFRANDGEPSKAFVIMLVVMMLGIIAFLRYRRALRAATNRLTEWMSKPPGGSAPRPLAAPGHGAHLMKAASLYGAGKVLSSPQGRQALKNTAAVGAAALTGNPALAGRVILNSAAAKKARNALGSAIRPKPAPTTAASSDGGYVAFSGRATRPASTTTMSHPSMTATRRSSATNDDTVVLEGTVVDSSEGPQYPRLPMRRTRVFVTPPTRPSSPRPQLPPPPPPAPPPPPPAPPQRPNLPPRKPTGPPTPGPQDERPPRIMPRTAPRSKPTLPKMGRPMKRP